MCARNQIFLISIGFKTDEASIEHHFLYTRKIDVLLSMYIDFANDSHFDL